MEIDHIGIIVNSIDKALQEYLVLGYKKVGEKFLDNNQYSYVLFLSNGGYKVELIEPVNETSPTYELSKKEHIIAHICYRVKYIHKEICRLEKNKFLLIDKPKSAPAFKNKLIAFLFSRQSGLIELVED